MAEGAGDGATAGSQGGGPGALSRLLAELAEAPHAVPGKAWAKGLEPGDVLDRFEILRELGRGGFGAVYEALDRELGRKVALKTLRPGRSRDEWADAQLRKEAQAAASLAHPGIVTLHEACTCDRGPYLVMELLRGETLEARLARGPLPPAEAVEVGLQMARALAHVHGHGLVHRDLKPGNVFLGEDGRVKLLDLGLAHLLGRRSSTGGTPAYVAPEQWRGEEVDGRADVFALGAVLFEMVSGRRAFAVKEERSSALDPGPAPALGGKVPRGLARLVARCLSKEPSGRPTAAQAAEELLGIQRGQVRPEAVRRVGLLVGAGVIAGIAIAAVALRGHLLGPERGAPPDGEDVATAVGAGKGSAGASATAPSIAVLPFADLSPGKDQEYFADGIAEEILNALAQVRGLKVAGRTSSFSFKGKNVDLRTIGGKLGVAAVLEGSVRRDGDRVRVTAQLMKADDGFHLWSERYERDLTSIFSVQDEIARAVVANVAPVLVGKPGTEIATTPAASPEAYDWYLVGKQALRQNFPEAYRRAADAYERAVAIEPGYAPAWAGLAFAAYWSDHPAPERAMAAAERAVALDPTSADALTARGHLRALHRFDWDGARGDFDRARTLHPGDPDVLRRHAQFLLRPLGRFAEAIAAVRRATELDPLSPHAWTYLAALQLAAGDAEASRRAAERALEISPKNVYAESHRGRALLLLGRPSDALASAQRAADLALVAIAHHELGHGRESRRALEGLVSGPGSTNPVTVAGVHAWRGEPGLAFEWLDRALAQRDQDLAFLKSDVLLRRLHADPRFAELLRKMNLPVD